MAWCSSKCEQTGDDSRPAGGDDAAAGSDSERLERLGREEILRTEPVLREPLLLGVSKEGRKRLAIAIQPVRPVVVAHLASHLVEMRDEPRQHRVERRGLTEIGVGFVTRGLEGFCQRLRYPAMALVQITAD